MPLSRSLSRSLSISLSLSHSHSHSLSHCQQRQAKLKIFFVQDCGNKNCGGADKSIQGHILAENENEATGLKNH